MEPDPPSAALPAAPQPKDFDQLCREAGYKSYKEPDGTIVVLSSTRFTTSLIGRLYPGESAVRVEVRPRMRFDIALGLVILSGYATIAVALLAWFVLNSPYRKAWFEGRLGRIYQEFKKGVFE